MELTLDQALQKGIEAHKAGKVEEADRYYSAILKANPKHPDANHNIGVLAVGVGKVEEALPFFKAALEANPSVGQFWLSYIDALIKLNKIHDATDTLKQARTNGLTGDGFKKLEKKLGSPSLKNPNVQEPSREQLQELTHLYSNLKYVEILEQASQLLKQFPNSSTLYGLIGAANQSLGQLNNAIEAYTKVLIIKPDNAEAYYNMGLALQDQGKLEEAIEAYRTAFTIEPDHAEAYNNLGNALQDQGKLEEAIEAYNKAISIKPDYADACTNVGNALNKKGKLKEAIEAYNKAISIKPDNSETHFNMGATLQEQGKLEEAIEAYRTAIAIKPDYTDAIENYFSLQIQLIGSPISEKTNFNIFRNLRSTLTKRPKFLILQAIHAFLNLDNASVTKHINDFNNSDLKQLKSLDPKNKIFVSAYSTFLEKLIAKPFDITNIHKPNTLIYHFGESHCLSYAHQVISLKSANYKIIPRIIFGAKAFHFSSRNINKFKAITETNFENIPNGSIIFLSFGEIDCRPNEGIISAAKKHNKPIEDLVSDTVKGYVSWIVQQNESKNHTLFFFNVPAPIYNERYTTEVNKEVLGIIKLFNSSLYRTVLDHDFNIIDVYKFTFGDDGFSNGDFHIDNFHLSCDALPQIEKQLGTIL